MVLSDDDGVIDLTGADSVELNFKDAPARRCSGATVSLVETRRACAVEVAASGQIRFDWIPADTATARSIIAEVIVTTNGYEERFPSSGFIPVTVLPNV